MQVVDGGVNRITTRSDRHLLVRYIFLLQNSMLSTSRHPITQCLITFLDHSVFVVPFLFRDTRPSFRDISGFPAAMHLICEMKFGVGIAALELCTSKMMMVTINLIEAGCLRRQSTFTDYFTCY